ESEVGHPDEVRVGKRERDPQAAAVGLARVPHFARQNVPRALVAVATDLRCGPRLSGARAGLAFSHTGKRHVFARAPPIRRRRTRRTWLWTIVLGRGVP